MPLTQKRSVMSTTCTHEGRRRFDTVLPAVSTVPNNFIPKTAFRLNERYDG